MLTWDDLHANICIDAARCCCCALRAELRSLEQEDEVERVATTRPAQTEAGHIPLGDSADLESGAFDAQAIDATRTATKAMG
jgi:hypothetical protein